MSTSKGSVSVELIYPIDSEGKSIKSVALRRPTVGDSVGVQQGAGSAPEVEIRLVSVLSGLSIETISKLDMKDYVKIQAALREMMA
jgi:hypothetical protein